ncbi:hypothetical protein E2C01_078278 [Portunus trituberculatus]|uniref:Uncharacterized protein n=1 Tax=Portunus trituberculatus TaxID=210409 RepID=A0A5B7IPP2_PORTR|nr:hypothetical protein [Portunus trituberculatus]
MMTVGERRWTAAEVDVEAPLKTEVPTGCCVDSSRRDNSCFKNSRKAVRSKSEAEFHFLYLAHSSLQESGILLFSTGNRSWL